MKRAVMIVAVLIVVVGAAGYGVFRMVGREGAGELENWVGRCVVGVIESHLTASVEFDQLDYQAPGTVILDGLKLVGADGLPLVEVAQVQLTLAEVPRLNQPVQIRSIDLRSPSLFFRQDARGGLGGWSSLVSSEVLGNGLDAVEKGYRLSDVLELRQINISDGRLEYATGGDEEPMILRGLTTSLNTEPQPDEPGWYAIRGSMARAPQLDIQYDGRANLDTMLIEIGRLNARMHLEEAQYETLPPQLQTLARHYALRGDLDAMISGSLRADDPLAGSINLQATLGDAFASFGESVLPIDEVRLTAVLEERALSLDGQADLLSGTAVAKASLALNDEMPLEANYEATGINLRQTLATTRSDAPPRYDGIVNLSGRLESRVHTLLESIQGGGRLTLERGRIVNLPVVSDLAKAVSAPFSKEKSGRDEALVDYQFRPDHLAISKLEFKSDIVAARGDGKVYYDRRLALAVNAGPMEKIQGHLGAIGDLLGKVTDKLVKYYVSGTVSEPKVSVKPLGIGAGG